MQEVGREAMIEVDELVKEYGHFRAVDRISFQVPRGQILGFLGPNGAGKSTTMKMLTGFIGPTSGRAKVAGFDVTSDSLRVRRSIGYLPESAPSYGEMTVSEFLCFIAEVRGFRGKERQVAAERMREVCALGEAWHQPIETLSKGYRQRVGFAQALLHDPPVLVLDEPTDGLDPNQKHEVRELIRRMGQDKTIILSTHILEEVEAICQRAIIIAHGRLVADATPADLMQQSSMHNAVTLRFSSQGQTNNDVARARELLAKVDKVERIEPLLERGDALRVFPKSGESVALAISELSRQNNWQLEQLQVEQGRLDEVFRKITGRGMARDLDKAKASSAGSH